MNGFGANAAWSLRALLGTDLTRRSDRHEILDDHGSDQALVAPTLRNLERINVLLSGIRRICRSTIIRDAKKNRLRDLTIADLGCGGGGLALWLARQCARHGITARVFGIDHDPRAVSIARSRCAHEPLVTITAGDATDPGILPDPIDWIVSNHFLHHLETATVTRMLKTAADRARRGIIMNDLVRSRRSLIEFNLLCRTLMPSGHTANDGMVSILRSFTAHELSAILASAGLSSKATITRSGIGHRAIVFRR